MILASLIILVTLLLETSVISIPLTLTTLIFFSFFLKKEGLYVLALASGILLDILSLTTIGISSAFFLFSLFVVYLYQKKIEQSSLFVFLASFVSGFMYLFIVKDNISIFAPLISSLLAFLIFSLIAMRKIKVKEKRLKFQI